MSGSPPPARHGVPHQLPSASQRQHQSPRPSIATKPTMHSRRPSRLRSLSTRRRLRPCTISRLRRRTWISRSQPRERNGRPPQLPRRPANPRTPPLLQPPPRRRPQRHNLHLRMPHQSARRQKRQRQRQHPPEEESCNRPSLPTRIAARLRPTPVEPSRAGSGIVPCHPCEHPNQQLLPAQHGHQSQYRQQPSTRLPSLRRPQEAGTRPSHRPPARFQSSQTRRPGTARSAKGWLAPSVQGATST